MQSKQHEVRPSSDVFTVVKNSPHGGSKRNPPSAGKILKAEIAEGGGRRVGSGEWRVGNTSPLAPLPIRCGEGNHWRSLAGSARSRPKQSRLRAWLEHRNPTLLPPPPPRQLWQNFEDEAEADDEEDSVPVNFQTGFHVRLPRNHFTKKERPPFFGGRLSFLILFHACTVACTAMLTGWLQTPTRASFKRKMAR